MSSIFTIRSVTTLDEFAAIEELQRVVWGMDTDTELVPAHLLITVHHYGGVVLGAFTPENQMIGFVFGFAGIADDKRSVEMGSKIIHCSHMMGILPDYRGHSLGYALKCAQREAVLKQDTNLIVWTYDPLLQVNASLNIARLGGVCRTYFPNLYGELNETLNAGLPTDRFEVEWWIASRHVESHLDSIEKHRTLVEWRAVGAIPVNQTTPCTDSHRTPEGWEKVTSTALLVEIPVDFQSMRKDDLALAHDWRLHTREIFLWAFAEGYSVEGFVTEWAAQDRRAYYVLTSNVNFHILAGGHYED